MQFALYSDIHFASRIAIVNLKQHYTYAAKSEREYTSSTLAKECELQRTRDPTSRGRSSHSTLYASHVQVYDAYIHTNRSAYVSVDAKVNIYNNNVVFR